MERISTKTIGAQLSAVMALGAALDAVRAAGIKSLDLSSDERGTSQLEDCAAEYLAELSDEAQSRIHEIFVDVGGQIVARGKRGGPAFTDETRAKIVDVLRAASWAPDAIQHMLDIVVDSVADGCFLPEPSGAPTVTKVGTTVTPIARLPDGSTVFEVVEPAGSTPGELGEAAAARDGVTFVEPATEPIPVHVDLREAATIAEALELWHDMADAHEDDENAAKAQRTEALQLITKFKAVIARNASQPPELSDVELKTRGLRRLEQGDDVSQIVEVAGHEYMPIDAPCPGCGCMPGDGLTKGCEHPAGCGYWRPLEQTQICGALPMFEGAGPCERSPGHEGQHAAKGKRWDPVAAAFEHPATYLAEGSKVGPVTIIGGRPVVDTERAPDLAARSLVADIRARAEKVLAAAPTLEKPTGADLLDLLEVLAAQSIVAEVGPVMSPPYVEPTSSACKREPWCVLQVGHEGPCLPTMLPDGSF